MPKSDPRYADWPHRKPSKKSKARARIAAVTGLDDEEAAVAQAILTPVARRATSVGRRVLTKVGGVGAAATVAAGQTAGLGALTTASLVVLTGLASYYATRAIIEGGNSRENREYAAANEYRAARQEFARRMGRPLTADENKVLAAKFKEQMALAISGAPTVERG
jgi:hypothetical protein